LDTVPNADRNFPGHLESDQCLANGGAAYPQLLRQIALRGKQRAGREKAVIYALAQQIGNLTIEPRGFDLR
jgi:hypothetical protein